MPAMLWLYTSHASYALAYPMPAMLWLLFIPDMPAMLWLYTSHASYALAYPMPAMLWLYTSHASYARLKPSVKSPCLESGSVQSMVLGYMAKRCIWIFSMLEVCDVDRNPKLRV